MYTVQRLDVGETVGSVVAVTETLDAAADRALACMDKDQDVDTGLRAQIPTELRSEFCGRFTYALLRDSKLIGTFRYDQGKAVFVQSRLLLDERWWAGRIDADPPHHSLAEWTSIVHQERDNQWALLLNGMWLSIDAWQDDQHVKHWCVRRSFVLGTATHTEVLLARYAKDRWWVVCSPTLEDGVLCTPEHVFVPHGECALYRKPEARIELDTLNRVAEAWEAVDELDPTATSFARWLHAEREAVSKRAAG